MLSSSRFVTIACIPRNAIRRPKVKKELFSNIIKTVWYGLEFIVCFVVTFWGVIFDIVSLAFHINEFFFYLD